MSDAYDNVVGGRLNLKGIGKKKKKKDRDETAEKAAAAVKAAEENARDAALEAARARADTSSSSTYVGHTGAEMRRLQVAQERKLKLLDEGKLKTHRDQVKDFNGCVRARACPGALRLLRTRSHTPLASSRFAPQLPLQADGALRPAQGEQGQLSSRAC